MENKTYYKLTDQNCATYRGYQWVPGEWRMTDGSGELCGPGWLHGYHHPLLAAFLNPIHANIMNPRLWAVETDGLFRDDNGLKFGTTKMRLVEELEMPEVTTTQRVAFAILCAKEVCRDAAWNSWADRWLSGEDRSVESAYATIYAAWKAASAARAASAASAAWKAAFNAAYYAAWKAASNAAYSALDAAQDTNGKLDLIAIAQKAMQYK